MRIGIDVGGTNTDAVVVNGTKVIATTKRPTTPDINHGIDAVLADLSTKLPGLAPEAVMVGTTHFVNALIRGRELSLTAAVRLGLPSTAALPPFVAWPERITAAVSAVGYLCHGGHEFDGRPISPLDRDELLRVAEDIGARGIRSIALTSVFSPATSEFEVEAAAILAEVLPEASITLSHEIGRMGLLERENATIINAALRDLAENVTSGLLECLRANGIDAPLYLSQNDGTLMDVEYARKYPVATFASGPTNSMRGAAYLSGLEDCIVVDIGGTTTDVGQLHNGFPREATNEIEVAGIRTNFRMPDVLSIGLGGGSIAEDGSDGVSVGPASVGYEVTSKALIFGGGTMTATDLAVAGRRAELGEPDRLASLDPDLVRRGLQRIDELVQGAVDRVRTSTDTLPVVVVGGGAILLADELPGLGNLVRPDHHTVANAVGAAMAQVSGEIDRIVAVAPGQRSTVLDEAKQEAMDRAIAAGARPGSVEIVELEEVPIAYLPGNATRVRVKAVGEIISRTPRSLAHTGADA